MARVTFILENLYWDSVISMQAYREVRLSEILKTVRSLIERNDRHTRLLYRSERKKALNTCVPKLLKCLYLGSRTLGLRVHSRHAIPTQTGLKTIGEACRQGTTLPSVARHPRTLFCICPTRGRSLTAPWGLGRAESTFCHPTGTCLSVVPMER
jgi:hypothetical protein